VAAGAISLFGVAVGSWIAGQQLERWADTGPSALLVGCAATGLLLPLPVTIALDRVARREAAAAGERIVRP
jgi:hypothetical protein